MNTSELEKLKDVIDLAIEAEKKRAEDEYRSQVHLQLKKGDWVTNGEDIGVVGWVDEEGYFGFDIKNGSGCFRSPCRCNDYVYLSDELKAYYTSTQTISLNLSGEEIESFYMSYMGLRNVNPSSLKTKLIDAFDSVRQEPK